MAVPGGAQRNGRNGNAFRRNATRRNRTAALAWLRPSSGRHKWLPYGGGAGGAQRNRLNRTALRRNATAATVTQPAAITDKTN